jgi:hypothetical protein
MTSSQETSAPRPLGFNFRALIARVDGTLTNKRRTRVVLTKDEWLAVKAAITTLAAKMDDPR